MLANTITLDRLSTEELKEKILSLTKDRDTDPLKEKVVFHKDVLSPYFEALQQRNPYPNVADQVPIILGVWTPVWSTIPFHDALPGRELDKSYQIFKENGYYANIARYAPGHQRGWLNKLSAFMAAYDLMVMQKFEIRDGQWFIQNVAIDQAVRRRIVSLTIERAESWFAEVLDKRIEEFDSKTELPKELKLANLDRNTVKKFEKTYLATPKFEHVYIDQDLRIVKTQREAKQRPSYTIALRRKFAE
ncbi:MAG: hypothetical protein MUC48_25810 [Leptolyngbya sp. Prado105]|nr:hypothetical protein [Leptolyngbya sp. Prado105]